MSKECAINVISCDLSRVVEAIGQPNWVEVVALIVAAAGAAGTIWIALLNLRFQTMQKKEAIYAQRRGFAHRVAQWAENDLAHRLIGEPISFDDLDQSLRPLEQQAKDFTDESATNMLLEVRTKLSGSKISDFGLSAYFSEKDTIDAIIDSWAKDALRGKLN